MLANPGSGGIIVPGCCLVVSGAAVCVVTDGGVPSGSCASVAAHPERIIAQAAANPMTA
jgi:hypothetical protein